MSYSLFDELGSDPVNVFYLDHDPEAAARAHCDSHVVKMIVETAQLLSTAWHLTAPAAVSQSIGCTDPLFPYAESVKISPGMSYYIGNQRIYAPTHPHHPSAVWARESTGNYEWLWQLGMYLLDEYTHRYRRLHRTRHVLRTLELPPPGTPTADACEPPPAMPEEFWVVDKDGLLDAVESYRTYYRIGKRPLLTYTRRNPPDWCAAVAVCRTT